MKFFIYLFGLYLLTLIGVFAAVIVIDRHKENKKIFGAIAARKDRTRINYNLFKIIICLVIFISSLFLLIKFNYNRLSLLVSILFIHPATYLLLARLIWDRQKRISSVYLTAFNISNKKNDFIITFCLTMMMIFGSLNIFTAVFISELPKSIESSIHSIIVPLLSSYLLPIIVFTQITLSSDRTCCIKVAEKGIYCFYQNSLFFLVFVLQWDRIKEYRWTEGQKNNLYIHSLSKWLPISLWKIAVPVDKKERVEQILLQYLPREYNIS